MWTLGDKYINSIEDKVLKYYMIMKIRKIKSKDVAKAIGVSEPAISRYFNKKMSLSKDKEKAMFQYIEGLDK